MTFTQLWKIITDTPETSHQKAKTAHTTIARKCPIVICRDGHLETSSEDVRLQPVCTSHDQSLHKVNNSCPEV